VKWDTKRGEKKERGKKMAEMIPINKNHDEFFWERAGLLAVKSGFILFIKNYQFPLQINTLEREEKMAEHT